MDEGYRLGKATSTRDSDGLVGEKTVRLKLKAVEHDPSQCAHHSSDTAASVRQVMNI